MLENVIRTQDDLLKYLDIQFSSENLRWNNFFSSLPVSHPLATNFPDEHLVTAVQDKLIHPGSALDIGCGNGRNSVYLARNGFQVDALDISEEALLKSAEAALSADIKINFMLGSFFEVEVRNKTYDVIYDFGCLHHVQPQRRPQYINFVSEAIKPSGVFVLGCFNEKMGTAKSDAELLRSFDMEGGLSFSPCKLHHFFDSKFELLEMRKMKSENSPERGVGWDHMSVSFWRRRA